MSILSRFSIIVAVDNGNGISKDGSIPWDSREDMKFFKDMTIGNKKNVVIMGRLTYESIPVEYRPLKDRTTIVVSATWKPEEHSEAIVCPSLLDALKETGTKSQRYDKIFVCGGERLYEEAISHYMYLCDRIYVTKFKTDYHCDKFFPLERVKDFDHSQDPT